MDSSLHMHMARHLSSQGASARTLEAIQPSIPLLSGTVSTRSARLLTVKNPITQTYRRGLINLVRESLKPLWRLSGRAKVNISRSAPSARAPHPRLTTSTRSSKPSRSREVRVREVRASRASRSIKERGNRQEELMGGRMGFDIDPTEVHSEIYDHSDQALTSLDENVEALNQRFNAFQKQVSQERYDHFVKRFTAFAQDAPSSEQYKRQQQVKADQALESALTVAQNNLRRLRLLTNKFNELSIDQKPLMARFSLAKQHPRASELNNLNEIVSEIRERYNQDIESVLSTAREMLKPNRLNYTAKEHAVRQKSRHRLENMELVRRQLDTQFLNLVDKIEKVVKAR